MKNVKKRGIFALLIVMLLALTACGEPQPSATPSSSVTPSDDSVQASDSLVSCTVSINCESALESDVLSQDLRDMLPEDGVLLAETTLSLPSGTTAFEMLEQAAEANDLVLDVSQSGTLYVRGIENLYEQSCGDLSGWLYMVNGEMAQTSASEYVLEDGDKVEWVFSTDMGKEFS